MNYVTVLPLAFVMIAGPQIITAVFSLPASNGRETPRRTSPGQRSRSPPCSGPVLRHQSIETGGRSHGGATSHVIESVILVLLLVRLLLLGVFPSDILTSITVGSHLADKHAHWVEGLPFILLALLLLALPALLVLVLGNRANVFLPQTRDWMNANSWIISEIVLVSFMGITVKTVVG